MTKEPHVSSGEKSKYQLKRLAKLRCRGNPQPQWMYWYEPVAKKTAPAAPVGSTTGKLTYVVYPQERHQ